MTYQIKVEPRGLYCIYAGKSGMHDVLAAVEEISALPDADRLRYAIHDCSQVTEVMIQSDSLTLVSAQAIGFAFSNKQLKAALITTDPSVLQALSKYSAMTGREVVVFADAAAARDWASAF